MQIERAVINSGPLVAFSLMRRLDLLPSLFREFWIPERVFHEVVVAGFGRVGSDQLAEVQWTSHVRASPEPDPLLVVELDPGEAAVIPLARTLTPCLVVIDERRGRRIADQVYGLPVKGTAGLLVEAYRRGLLKDVRTTLLDLKQAGYFLSERVIEAACRAARSNDSVQAASTVEQDGGSEGPNHDPIAS
jgi:predicted nucleic acid-binding protein